MAGRNQENRPLHYKKTAYKKPDMDVFIEALLDIKKQFVLYKLYGLCFEAGHDIQITIGYSVEFGYHGFESSVFVFDKNKKLVRSRDDVELSHLKKKISYARKKEKKRATKKT